MKKIVGHTTENVATLPRWARERIERLTKEAESWKARALSASSPETTNITIMDGMVERGLPENSRVRFRLDGTVFEVGLRDDAIELRSLDGTLAVFPMVSNVITVKRR